MFYHWLGEWPLFWKSQNKDFLLSLLLPSIKQGWLCFKKWYVVDRSRPKNDYFTQPDLLWHYRNSTVSVMLISGNDPLIFSSGIFRWPFSDSYLLARVSGGLWNSLEEVKELHADVVWRVLVLCSARNSVCGPKLLVVCFHAVSCPRLHQAPI